MSNYFPKTKNNNVLITVTHPTKSLWYFYSLNEWKELDEYNSELDFSSHFYGKCNSKKALIRKLRKWNLPKNSKIYVETDNAILNLSVH